MKIYLLTFLVFFISACNQSNKEVQQMQLTIDSLQKKLNDTYKPGFGEFMSGIQVHHAKLWFAGENQNWPLADFEIHEIQESLDDIKKFCSDRPETKSIGMIDLPIDSIANAIQQKDQELFKKSFILLTNTCNNCHRATEHAFNVVMIPNDLPVVNQDFKPVHSSQ
jgi:hypothetical protein